MNLMKKLIRNFINQLGYDLIPYTYRSHPTLRQKMIMENQKIDLILDVGANIGNYGHKLIHKMNYSGEIISFEPMEKEFITLKERCLRHDNWSSENIALGQENCTSLINISANSVSSSLLEILPDHTNSAPTSKFIETQEIQVHTLDHFLTQKNLQSKNILLKLDVQGYEMEVLKGAQNHLSQIKMMHVELSLDDLYQGGALFDEIYQYLRSIGFKLVGVEPGFSRSDTGELLQLDGLFVRCD